MTRTRSLPGRLVVALAALAMLTGLVALPSSQPTAEASSKTPVMGKSRLTPAQMAAFFHANTRSPYRATVPVEFLAAYYVTEGNAEGVAGDIAFAQAILETGWFSFPSSGQVRGSDNNFAGMGAFDGASGQWVFRFPTARIGVRAQLQHLRVYADPNVNTTGSNLGSPLAKDRENRYPDRWRWVRNATNSSGRHLYWARARNWEDFGGGMWATDPAYSTKVLNLYNNMRAFANANPHLTGTWLFSDVPAGNTFEADIINIAIADITRGCGGDRYCPKDPVTRAEMATFMVRALGLSPSSRDRFRDVSSSNTHRRNINALARAGITAGCNPPANDRFCPNDPVTREQMASFMVRALDDLSPSGRNRFSDVSSSNTHRRDINALGGSSIARGCNPPSNSRYCPKDIVTREQMAAFLRRAFL
jgi:hypothetical protein